MKTEIKTILIPIDFTVKSNNALQVAVKMAERHEAKLIITHSVQTYYMIGRGGKQVIGSETVQENTDRAVEKLNEVRVSILKEHHIEVETRISNQNILDSINDFVVSDNIDLVVIASSGEQNVKQFILGSNSYSVLLHANCSVLLIPEKFKKTSFKKILFPVRVKSELDQKADLSILLADKNDGNINLLGVGDPDRMLAVKKAYIEMKKNLKLNAVDHESEFLLSYDNAEIIAQVAKDKNCDIILLADEDENSWKSFMADNFFKKIINGTDIPLFIVKSKLKRINNKTDQLSGYDLTLPALG